MSKIFPEGFLWGASSSAHQVEGNKMLNNWIEHESLGFVDNQEKSGIAVDHYNRYEQDFDLAKAQSHNIHRLSIEWSRIQPKKDSFDEKEISHYLNVLKALKKRNIKVVLTLFHFTVPIWFEKIGGFEKRENLIFFLKFTEKIIPVFQNYVDYWITINEPTIYIGEGYIRGKFPPRKRNIFLANKTFLNLMDLHKKIYYILHSFDTHAQVSLSHNCPYIVPFRNNSLFDVLIAKILNYFSNQRVLNSASNELDFIGINYYVRLRIKFRLFGKYLGLFDEFGVLDHDEKVTVQNNLGWEIYPEGIFHVLKNISKYNKPILITENGVADADDHLRKDFIYNHLKNIYKAIESGINVIGYIHWSLTDNFEWNYGRRGKFGLIEIDYKNNLERKVRPSAKYYAVVCKSNKI